MREPSAYEAPSCATVGGDYWFPEKEAGGIGQPEAKIAKSICRSCPHRTECAEWGIYNELHGIWGGLADLDRRRIRRQRGIKLNQEDKSA